MEFPRDLETLCTDLATKAQALKTATDTLKETPNKANHKAAAKALAAVRCFNNRELKMALQVVELTAE